MIWVWKFEIGLYDFEVKVEVIMKRWFGIGMKWNIIEKGLWNDDGLKMNWKVIMKYDLENDLFGPRSCTNEFNQTYMKMMAQTIFTN